MKISDFVGVAGGMTFASIGLFFAPSPAYDTGGWNRCGLWDVFPFRPPGAQELKPNPFGFDNYECVVTSSGVLLVLVYLSGVFMISGALASRIGELASPTRGAISVAIVSAVTLLVGVSSAAPMIYTAPTLSVGVGSFVGAVLLAFCGGHLATRSA
jgi:hypothetical protein